MALTDKLKAIANGFRSSRGTTKEYSLDEMAILAAEPASTRAVVEPLTVTENGTYTPSDGVDGYNPVTVNVASTGGSEWEEQFMAAIERDKSKPVTKLPDGLTKIAEYAFYNYNGLTLTSLPAGITSIGDSAFNSCIQIALTSLPAGLTSIGSSAFRSCSKLALTSLPTGLTSIGSSAFSSCSNLALTSLPTGITSIGSSAFESCSNLALTSLPAGIKSIGGMAFKKCDKLTELTFNGKPTSITDTAFQYCFNLHTINVPWAEGEVSGAPWGATNATINYNYTGG